MIAGRTVDGGGSASWRAGVLLYSGRPDPSWSVTSDAATAWVSRFERLARSRTPLPHQARLGYRGVWLRAPDGRRWDAFLGVTWSADDQRRDPGREMERTLLESAPGGVLPTEWREWLVE